MRDLAGQASPTPGSYLVIQISLSGIGTEAVGNHEPLVHIGLWGNPLDFDEILMGFPCDLVNGYDLSLEEGRLFRGEHSEYDNEWCYSVRLTDLNRPDDVQRNIINPIGFLLLGGDVAQALSSTAAVQYAEVDGNGGHYRIVPRDCSEGREVPSPTPA